MISPEEFQQCVRGTDYRAARPAPAVAAVPTIAVDSLSASSRARYAYDDGDKFWGGFGTTKILTVDYWTLRARSVQLFETNLFARGIIRRLVTNEITNGLNLEADPNEALLGLEAHSLDDWSEDIENRFAIWGKNPLLCDQTEQNTFGKLQQIARREALICGDVLVTLQASGRSAPRIRLISGDAVQTPAFGGGEAKNGNRIEHGVELDSSDRHVAYWIRQRDGSSKRLPAWGEKSGRRLAWLVYGADKRAGDVRGKPLLSLVLQSLAELDRYRDAVGRKALLNSFLTLWVEKTADKPGSRALSSGAKRIQKVVTTGATAAEERSFQSAEIGAGFIVEELQVGEKIHAHGSNGTDEKYGDFEEAMVQGIAYSLEIPPEVLRLSFSSNYSASKAAENNFSVYLFKTREGWGEEFCQPVYSEWLLSETLAGNVDAAGLLDSWRDRSAYVTFGAWTASDWSGHVKPSVDPVKTVNALDAAVAAGYTTRGRACREFSGLKFSRVVRDLKTENEMLVEANKPLLELEPKPVAPPAPTSKDESDGEDAAVEDDKEDAA
jgi:capsid protein